MPRASVALDLTAHLSAHDSLSAPNEHRPSRPSPEPVKNPDTLFLRGRVVVISPHLDDAALSCGATIARITSAGGEVSVLTVLAGDPEDTSAAGCWDAACGFETAGEAARKRRLEDSRGCEIVGAEPEWLPFPDEQYERSASDDEIWAAIEPSDWPHFCAPSPESLMISMMCSLSRVGAFARAGALAVLPVLPVLPTGFCRVIPSMVFPLAW